MEICRGFIGLHQGILGLHTGLSRFETVETGLQLWARTLDPLNPKPESLNLNHWKTDNPGAQALKQPETRNPLQNHSRALRESVLQTLSRTGWLQ